MGFRFGWSPLGSLGAQRVKSTKVFEMLYQIVVPSLFEPYRVVGVEETGDERHHEIRSVNDHGCDRRS